MVCNDVTINIFTVISSQQCFSETLRLYSPIGQLFRICRNDYKVPETDFVIKKGIPLMIPVHAIHHDSRYYYDPYNFDPERFSTEEIKKRPTFTFLPFGILYLITFIEVLLKFE
jgi:cytochrome P450 family 6